MNAEPVSDTTPDLFALRMLQDLQHNPAACRVLADWLAERGDPRADAVRELCAAPVVAPAARPGYVRKVGEPGFDAVPVAPCRPGDRGAEQESYPLCAGSFWAVEWWPPAVVARVYRRTAHGEALARTFGGFDVNSMPMVEMRDEEQTPEAIRAAAEECRRDLLRGLFGQAERPPAVPPPRAARLLSRRASPPLTGEGGGRDRAGADVGGSAA